jgi:rubrerythrin
VTQSKLGTFGAILAYAMYLEQQAEGFHAAAAHNGASPDLARVLGELAADARKRSETLQRVRSENVTEMILTPIHDFDAADYILSFSADSSPVGIRAAAVAIEQLRERYYRAAQSKTELVEVARILSRMAHGNQKNAGKL